MLQRLPPESFHDAQTRSRASIRNLCVLLAIVYSFSFVLLLGVFLASLGLEAAAWVFAHLLKVSAAAVLLGAGIAAFQIQRARQRTLDEILRRFRAVPYDRSDSLHRRFANIVSEVEVATGCRPIQPVVIATVGCNAFAAATNRNEFAIGVTEGALARLSRAELSAVVAQQGAHLVAGDARLTTIAASIFGVFDELVSQVEDGASDLIRSDARAFIPVAAVWIAGSIGRVLLRFVSLAISREKEFAADAVAVRMTLDPISLADALRKMSARYRGSTEISEFYAPSFIITPRPDGFDELNRFFGTHPPIRSRVEKLMAWARAEVHDLRDSAQSQLFSRAEITAPRFHVHTDGEWIGPFLPSQLLALDLFLPETWISMDGSGTVHQASEDETCRELLEHRERGPVVKERCPVCKTSLIARQYEGAATLHCPFCRGYLVPFGTLERIIARREEKFTLREIREAKAWRKSRGRIPKWESSLPCPACGKAMFEQIHSCMTKVIFHRCSEKACATTWCDGGDIERLQILVENASAER